MKASETSNMVFHLYLAVIKKNGAYIAMYFSIFIVIAVMITHNQRGAERELFERTSVPVSVIDEDRSVTSDALTAFLSESNEVVFSDGDETELTRGLYYREIGYILTIPAGFGEGLLSDDPAQARLDVVKLPGSAAGYYLDADIEQFLTRYRAYLAAGFSPEEAGKKTLALKGSEKEVTIAQGAYDYGNMPEWTYTFNYMPYLYLSVLIYCVSFVLKSFRDKHVEDRLRACPVPARTQALQGFLAFSVVFAGVWLISLLIPLISRGTGFYTSPHRGWIILNTFVFLLVAGSIAFLIGNLARSEIMITALTNVVGLGMCFLGGVFVSLDVLNENVQRFSRFLPTWWYVRAGNLLGMRTGASSAGDYRLVAESLLVQAAFAAAVFAVSLFLVRRRDRGQA